MPRILLSFAVLAVAAAAQQLQPREPLPHSPVLVPPLAERIAGASAWQDDLVVKFADAARVRATDDGGLRSKWATDLSTVEAVAREFDLSFAPLIRLPETKLSALEQRAAARPGVAQPDLAGMMIVTVPDGDIEAAGEALAALDLVEFASVHVQGTRPPGDIAPATPDLVASQTYRGADPGMQADDTLAAGVTGAGVRLSDCEYGWVGTHEDLNDIDIHPEPGQTIHPDVISFGWDEHGTAVLGETSAVHNGYGCSGMAADAEVHTYTEWSVEEGLRRVTSITNAIADSDAGDVVLLEMQNFAGAPAEVDPAVWTVVKAGTDAGVVVVGAAGNGNQNLDSGSYSSYQALGDSGAVIVGAGSSNTGHHKLGFSSYGSRVNVHGWGENVFSIGYGFFAEYGGDKNQRYTSSFSGTSSASPFVASAACLLQQRALDLYAQPLEPADLRQTLIDSGLPQGVGGNIGPFVQAKAAIDLLPAFFSNLGSALAGLSGLPVFIAQGTLEADDPYVMTLSNARRAASTWLVVGATEVNIPLKGGTLVPADDLLFGPFAASGAGEVSFSGSTPAGIPPGTEIFMQWWIQDPAAVKGWAASNAVVGVSP